VNIVELMQHTKGVFKDFGGHEMSGGFSLAGDEVHRFQEEMERAFLLLAPKVAEEPSGSETHDGLLTIAEANESAYRALRELGPFGQGNPKPMFRIERTRVEKLFRFGAGSEHARMLLSDSSGRSLDAISFFVARQSYRDTLELVSPGDIIDIEGSIEQSYFRGLKELRFRLGRVSFASSSAA
jgi:single-stranded-DNA-specific exonuclease